MNLTATSARSNLCRRRWRRRAWLNVDMLEIRRLLAGGGVPAGMDLGQANWFYQNVFLPPASVAPEWNGDVATGDAGTLGADYLAAIVARVNAYRWMAGLPGGITLDPTENAEDQQDALMTAANDQLDHFPPSTWIDYTAAGADAAANSDLALGASGTSAIDLFMTDPGANNTVVGHRRWILDPATQTMGVGDIPGESDSLWVIQPQTTPVPAVTTVAWPPAGFVPAPLIPDRWSLQAPYGSDFSNASVTVTENGVAQQVDILSNSGEDEGGQAIVWDMPDAPAPQPGQQVVYEVDVDNVVINGQSQSFSYTTTSFDPTTTTQLTPVPAAIGFVQTSAQTGAAAGSVTIDVARSMNTDQPVSVNYSTADGTAVAGTNYVATSGSLTFQPGQFYSQIVVPLLPGTAQQPGGTFSLNLSTTVGASVGPISSFQVTITPLQLTVSEPVGDVGAGSAFDLQFTAEEGDGSLDTADDQSMSFELTDTAGDQLTGNGYFVSGVADFPATTLDWTGSYTASVTSGTVTTTTPDALTVVPAGTTPTATPTPTPTPLVTVTSSQVETIKIGRGKRAKKETVLVVEFSGALSAASADNVSAYALAPIIKVKASGKGKNQRPATTKLGTPVSAASAVYNALNNSVTLTPRAKLTASKSEELIVNGTLVTDSIGREIDGNNDGQPGGNYIATINGSRKTAGGLPLARVREQPATVPDAIDVLLNRGELNELRLARIQRTRSFQE